MKRFTLFLLLHLACVCSYAQQAYKDTTFTNYFRRTEGWTGGDATISIPLPDGRNIWLFGDSYINNYQASDNTLPCLFQVRNCFTVQDALHLDEMETYIDYSETGIEQTYFKIDQVGNTVYWPGKGFVKKDTVFVFLEKYNGTTYSSKGHHLAKVLLPSFTLLSITELPEMNGITMGKAVIYDEASGYYYIYGNKLNWIVLEPYVARTKFKNLASGNWEFYTGNDWSANAADAQKICNDPVSPGFSVVKIKNSYYLVTQENGYLSCDLGRNIYSYSSSVPYGKFQTKRLLYTVEDQVNGHYLLTYNASAHPQFSENEELLISYNVNDAVDTLQPYVCPSQCKNAFTDRFDADSYRPKFVRIPYSMLGIKGPGSVSGHIDVQPNPVIDQVIAGIHSGISQKCSMTVINKMGSTVIEKKNVMLSEGYNTIPIGVADLPPDVYVLKVIGENKDGHPDQWEAKLVKY